MTEMLPIRLQGCNVDLDPRRKITVVPQSLDGELSEKQLVDYKDQRKQFLTWLLQVGKDPRRAEGYAGATVYNTAYRTARFDKWAWNHTGQYHYPPTEEDADDFNEHLAFSDKGDVEKGKLQEGIHRLNKWLQHKRGADEWEFEFRFSSSGSNLEPADYLTQDERRMIRQAAINARSIPAYSNMTEEERQGWKRHLSAVLRKPAEEVTEEDFEEANGWEETSLVWTSLDAGLRPEEVRTATTDWVDTENGVLRIPHEDSAKNEGNWTVSLTGRTTTALERWLLEREKRDRYDDTDRLWLTAHGNAHGSQSLIRLLRRLCDDAGIDYEDRQMSWYTIRHSVGTYMTKGRDLKAAKDQLRHKSPQTTMKYDQVSVEDRRDVLEDMG